MQSRKDILSINEKRRAEINAPYDQFTGEGSLVPRREIIIKDIDGDKKLWLPIPMFEYSTIQMLAEGKSVKEIIIENKGSFSEKFYKQFIKEFISLRFDEDFEFYCITCITINNRHTGQPCKFRLNRPQRRYVAKLESKRLSGKPIRIRMTKARQWGGSTATQIYMGWMQQRRKERWNMAVCTYVEDQAKHVRGMYETMAENYPEEAGNITFKPYRKSSKILFNKERQAILGVGSTMEPNALRGFTYYMLHCSEVSSWKKTEGKSPEKFVQSLYDAVPAIPDTIIVEESTANGIGNYFHSGWINSINGTSEFDWFFEAWFDDENNIIPIDDYEVFISSLNEYEQWLFSIGATLEGINWYRWKLREKEGDEWSMKTENPSTWQEAFQSTGRRAFNPAYVERSRRWSKMEAFKKPLYKGDVFGDSHTGKEALNNVEFRPYENGDFWVWALPDLSIPVRHRYCVLMDIGGRSKGADWTVIRVFDRFEMMNSGVPEAIATWRGHLDQDKAIWKASQISKLYCDALFVPERNSINSEEDTDGDHFLTILDEIVKWYKNIFTRTSPEKIKKGIPAQYGFHTNKSTKPMIVDSYNKAIRDDQYIEYDSRACDEADQFEIKPNGSYGAVDGAHDDILVPTMIGVWCCWSYMPLPFIIKKIESKNRSIVSEASM